MISIRKRRATSSRRNPRRRRRRRKARPCRCSTAHPRSTRKPTQHTNCGSMVCVAVISAGCSRGAGAKLQRHAACFLLTGASQVCEHRLGLFNDSHCARVSWCCKRQWPHRPGRSGSHYLNGTIPTKTTHHCPTHSKNRSTNGRCGQVGSPFLISKPKGGQQSAAESGTMRATRPIPRSIPPMGLCMQSSGKAGVPAAPRAL